MEKEIQINEVYTLTIGDLDGMLNDFLSDLGVDEDVITQNQVEELAAKLIDRFLFESDPSQWDLNPPNDSKREQFCALTGLSACVLKVCECKTGPYEY